MKAIDRKLWRDLWRIRGQATAIAAVLASGVACFIMFLSTLDSLQLSRQLYYQNHRFADIFVPLKRAPESIRHRIAQLEGVEKVETRVVAPARIEIEGFAEPITGLITSVPDRGEPLLNRLYIRAGQSQSALGENEVVISEDFATAHALQPGDQFNVIVRGKRNRLRVVATGGSPEYVHQMQPGGMFPDFKHYGVMWMARSALSHAYDMEGAFNDVVISLSREANAKAIIDQLDDMLHRYGASGAYEREDQPSDRYLSEELAQLENLSGMFPIIFLGVAVFLLNVVISRLVSTQREQVAALKAFGYTNREVATHYVQLILIIILMGIAAGVLVGTWLGFELSQVFMRFFRLPFLVFELEPLRIIQASLITVIAGLLGTLTAIRTALRLRPAEAMRPEAPAVYRETGIERLGLRRLFSTLTRMILRHINHKPLKSMLSVLGIAFACAILMTGRFQGDTVNYMMDVHFRLSQLDDLSVTFNEPTSVGALHELRSLHGVKYGEAYRAVPVRLRHGHRSYRTTVQGFAPDSVVRKLMDTELQAITLPPSGLVLNEFLAGNILGVKPGDRVTLEVLEGKQAVREVPVVATAQEYLGLGAYMQLEALNRLILEEQSINGAYLTIDTAHADTIYRRLKEMPRVAGTRIRVHEIENFHQTMEETMLFWTFVATLFSIVIAIGVVYNSARITLTERSRELASMRVLGFTRGEISYVLLGELAILTLLALPPGMLLGYGLCGYIATNLQNELYRVPLILEPHTYAFAVLIVLLAALASSLVVRRHLDRLDLIEVLKTKE